MSQKRVNDYRFGLDPLTGQSLHHISFFLRHCIPLELVHDETQRRMIECDMFDAKRGSSREPGQQYSILTGSLSEGLGVPDFSWITSEGLQKMVVSRDKDEMIYEENWYKDKIPEGAHAYQEGPLFELESINETQENYARLRVSEGYRKTREAMGNPVQTKYLDNQTVKESLLSTYQNETIYPSHLGLPVEVHGPSVTLTCPTHNSLDRDICVGIRFSDWPVVARDWPRRTRRAGWPDRVLVERVLQEGHFMVAVGQKGSSSEQLQWRYSFSAAEKLLARSLRPLVRKAYIIIKILHSFYFKDPGVLPTYFLKTILFWHCENHRTHLWQEGDLASIVFCLLDRIQYSLARGEVPHYFIPNVNLLLMVPREFLNTLSKKIHHVRSDLFSHLHKVIEEVQFVDLPLRNNFVLLLSAFAKNAISKPLDNEAFKKDTEGVLFDYIDGLIGLLKVQEMHLEEGPNPDVVLKCQCTRSRVVRILGPVWRELITIVQSINKKEDHFTFILLRLCLLREDELLLAKTFVWCLMEGMGVLNPPTLNSLNDELGTIFTNAVQVCQQEGVIRCGRATRSQDEIIPRLGVIQTHILQGRIPIQVFMCDNTERHMRYLRSTALPDQVADMSHLVSQLAEQLADIIPGLRATSGSTNDTEKILKLLMQKNNPK